MADECVVCGEAVEGKPLYKKLGSGEFNVEVITALRALQLTCLPETAKNDSYICWDCDEVIVVEYGKYLENEKHHKTAAAKQKQFKKQHKAQRKKQQTGNFKKQKTGDIKKKQSALSIKHPETLQRANKNKGGKLSKTKQLELRRANNAHHSTHCVMCDSNFETGERGYQRFPLKKSVTDEMDIAQVMELLGLARHIEPKMKGRRFVCNPCFVIIRRNYKNKLMKGSSIEGSSCTDTALTANQNPIHRATTEEHAAEIAKLLPPALAECYKILTSDYMTKEVEDGASKVSSVPQVSEVSEDVVRSKMVNHNNGSECQDVHENVPDTGQTDDQEIETEAEEEDSGLNVSQDEHGNYFIDMDVMSSPGSGDDRLKGIDRDREAIEEKSEDVASTLRKKKNVLLPRRSQYHLSGNLGDNGKQLEAQSGIEREARSEAEEGCKDGIPAATKDLPKTGICNICGISFSGKPQNWWHTLSSPLSGFESITITMALKLLETSLADTDKETLTAQQVCLPCYGMVSAGFRSQVVQRIARQKNIDVSQVNISKVKVRMLPKENLKSAVENQSESSRKTVVEKCDIGTEITRECEKENSVNSEKGQKRKFDETEGKRKRKKTIDQRYDVTKAQSVKNKDKDNNKEATKTKKISPGRTQRTKRQRSCSTITNHRNVRLRGNVAEIEETYRDTAHHSSTYKDDTSVVGYFSEKSLINQQAKHRNLKKILNQNRKPKAVVVLKDLKCVLPQEAFGGKAVSALKIEGNINQQSSPSHLFADHSSEVSTMRWTSPSYHSNPVQSDPGAHSSPLQFIFNTLSSHQPHGALYSAPTYLPKAQPTSDAHLDEDIVPSSIHIRGCCMVCGFNYMVPENFWYNIEEDIKPPTLMVSVRWVCVSLNVAPVQLTQRDRDDGKVCRHCFIRLAKQFEIFVRIKIGDSCGMTPESIDLSEYLIAFNPSTMNIEADPKQHLFVEEIEDVGDLLMKILPVIQSFSIDDVVGRYHRQPLSMQDFSVWMLLVLNDLRIQIGASIGDLAAWLVLLMPSEMYDKGLRLCESKLASFLLNMTKFSDTLTEDKLSAAIPQEVFIFENRSQSTLLTLSDIPTKTSTQNSGKGSKCQQNGEDNQLNCLESDLLENEELNWEDFLECVNLDKLMKGIAKPLSVKQFNNGILYSLWRMSQMIGEGDHVVIDWLRQLSPVPLQEDQLKKLLAAVGPLHEHLLECPEDIQNLKCEIIPQLKCSQSLQTLDQQNQGNKNLDADSYHSFICESKKEKMQMLEETVVNRNSQSSSPRMYNTELKDDCRPISLEESNINTELKDDCRPISLEESNINTELKDDCRPISLEENNINTELKDDCRPISLEESNINKVDKSGPKVSGITKRRRGRPRKRPLTLAESCLTAHQISKENVSLETSRLMESSDAPLSKGKDLSLNATLTSAASSLSVHPSDFKIASQKTTIASPEWSASIDGNSEESISDIKSEAVDCPPILSNEKKDNIDRVPETDDVKSIGQITAKEKAECNQTRNTEANLSPHNNDEQQLHNSSVRQRFEGKTSTENFGNDELECGDITTEKTKEQNKLQTRETQNTESEERDHPYIDEDKGIESQQIQTMLVNKVKKLEEELEELKKHSQKLMEANEKLVGVHADQELDRILNDQQQSTSTAIKNIENHLKAISHKKDTPHTSPTGMSQFLPELGTNDSPKGHLRKKNKYKKKESPQNNALQKESKKSPIKHDHSEKSPFPRIASADLIVGQQHTPESDKTQQEVKSHSNLKSMDIVSHSPKVIKHMEKAAGTSHKIVTDMLPQSSLHMTTKSTVDNLDVNLKHKKSKHDNYFNKKHEKYNEKQCKRKTPEKYNSGSSFLEKSPCPVSENAGIDVTKQSIKSMKERMKPSHVIIQKSEKSAADLKFTAEKPMTVNQVQSNKSKVSERLHRSSKKPKPSFEELMNYDAGR